MILYVDMFSGISGDMFLGALVDLGTPVDWLTRKLETVFKGFEIEAATVYPHHLRAIDIVVTATEDQPSHRHYTDIKTMIEKSPLPDGVKKNSLDAFEKIAMAESKIHGQDIETVHFHEVGAIDSLVDIIGTFLCVDYLGITKVYASRVPLGSGSVECAHGQIPVPVPATLAILKDTPVTSSDAATEIVTPTGAALITTLCSDFGTMPLMTIDRVGYGAGKRKTGAKRPNLLRILAGLPSDDNLNKTINKEDIFVVKANVDDMSPEISGYLMETLFDNSALDVSFMPVQMKKNRPGVLIEVMCRSTEIDKVIEVILTQSTSIGVRYHECRRAFLTRENTVVDTAYGKIQVKKIVNPDSSIRYVPEYETAKKIAKEKSIPLKDVYTQILSDAAVLDTDHDSI